MNKREVQFGELASYKEGKNVHSNGKNLHQSYCDLKPCCWPIKFAGTGSSVE